MDCIDKFHAPLFSCIERLFTPATGFHFPSQALPLFIGAPTFPEKGCMFSQTCHDCGQHRFN